MTPSQYKTLADGLAKLAKVENGLHQYFLLHRDRLWQTGSHFNIWGLSNKAVLEIGPFFSYTPFALKLQGNAVHVLEGGDPVIAPLKTLYDIHEIECTIRDLFETFGAISEKKHCLPYAENQFDVILCWETMEHFNFNPVGFIRELYRILKPGGKIFITVPNMTELENRLKLLLGKSICTGIENYTCFHNYSATERFLGFHWREYTLSEIVYLFRMQNFSIKSENHLLTFQNKPHLSLPRKIKRLAGKFAFAILPSTGNVCAIVAQKPMMPNL